MNGQQNYSRDQRKNWRNDQGLFHGSPRGAIEQNRRTVRLNPTPETSVFRFFYHGPPRNIILLGVHLVVRLSRAFVEIKNFVKLSILNKLVRRTDKEKR
jgi:hypothetical protein